MTELVKAYFIRYTNRLGERVFYERLYFKREQAVYQCEAGKRAYPNFTWTIHELLEMPDDATQS